MISTGKNPGNRLNMTEKLNLNPNKIIQFKANGSVSLLFNNFYIHILHVNCVDSLNILKESKCLPLYS